MITEKHECQSEFDALEDCVVLFVGEDETAFFEGFRTFCAVTDADGGDWVADGGVEAALFGESAGV